MRCFVALELTPDARAAAARAQEVVRSAAPGADVRWTRPDAFHVTVKFLGSVDDPAVPGICVALASVADGAGPVPLATGVVGAFPTPKRARVVWLGLSAGAADVARIAAATDVALAPLGFVAEARPFHAHLTLGRVRAPRALAALARAIEHAPPMAPQAWLAGDLVLFQSQTRPSGAVYTPVARFALGPRT